MDYLATIIYPVFDDNGNVEDITWLFCQPEYFDINLCQLPA